MIQQIAPDRLVFLDESGFSLALFRLYGWGKAKERLVESVPFVRGKNRSVLGAFSQAGMFDKAPLFDDSHDESRRINQASKLRALFKSGFAT